MQATYGELSAKTRALIEESTKFMDLAESLPVFKIDKDYVTKLDLLPSPADKAAALEAILTAELAEDDSGGLIYRQLGVRLARLKSQKDAADEAAEERLRELQAIADEKTKSDEEPIRLGLTKPGEYGLFTVLREYSASKDEAYLADRARHFGVLAWQSVALGGLEQFQRRADARGAVVVGGIVECTIRCARLRCGRCESPVPGPSSRRIGEQRWPWLKQSARLSGTAFCSTVRRWSGGSCVPQGPRSCASRSGRLVS